MPWAWRWWRSRGRGAEKIGATDSISFPFRLIRSIMNTCKADGKKVSHDSTEDVEDDDNTDDVEDDDNNTDDETTTATSAASK